MPTYRETIAQQVDQAIRDGIIQAGERDQAINFMSADERRAEFFGGGFMRTGDYTVKTKQIAEARRQADQEILAARQEEARRREELSRWESQARAELDQTRRQAAEATILREKVGKYEQLLSDFNLGEHLVPGGHPSPQPGYTPPPTQPTYPPPPTNPSQSTSPGYISEAQAAQALLDTLKFQGKVNSIGARHFQLFGQPLTDDIIGEAIAANQLNDIEGYWKTKYGVGAREAELQLRSREDEINKIRAEERAKIISEYANDPGRLSGGPLLGGEAPSAFANAYMKSRAVGYNPLEGPPDPSKPAPAPELIPPAVQINSRQQAFNKYWNSHFHQDGTLLPGVKPPANYGEGNGAQS